MADWVHLETGEPPVGEGVIFSLVGCVLSFFHLGTIYGLIFVLSEVTVMSKVKELVNQESRKLAGYLEKVQDNIAQIAKLQEYRQQAAGIERKELDRLADLCESYIEDINIFCRELNYLSQDRLEGKIHPGNNGLYRIDGTEIDLKDGYPLEIFVKDQPNDEPTWQFGRIMDDHIHDGLFFLSKSSKRYQLEPGMLVAVRPDSIKALEEESFFGKSSCSHIMH